MKRRINLSKITTFVLLLTVTAMILVAGTYAKYSSNASGTDATVVANWSFMVNDTDITTSETFTFDLFNTIMDSNGTDEETDIATVDDKSLIAPGTQGSFAFDLENTSDVTAKYEIKLSADNANIPLQYSSDGGTTWGTIDEFSLTDVIAIGGTDNATIMWKWDFNANDDTSLGTSETPNTIKVTATITATQVDSVYTNKLEQQYELNYYSNVSQAMNVINTSAYDDTSLTTTKDNASVAVYKDENDIANLVILKDSVSDTSIEPSTNMILDLAGRNLTFNSNNAINVTSGETTIKGTVDGSKISLTSEKATIAQVNTGSLTLNGGTYEAKSTGTGTDENPDASIVVGTNGTLIADKVDIVATDTNGATLAGILVEQGGIANVSNSNIEVTSLDGLKSDGIRNLGTMTLSNTNVAAYSNYVANDAGTDYAKNSRGINNDGTMTLKNCEVYGAHSGVRSTGVLYVDGGTYQGYGHGGFYFAGEDKTSYVKNATISDTAMKVGIDGNNDGSSQAGTNKAGMYIGGGSNIKVYMDSCNISATRYQMVIRSSSQETNNALYISNSTINPTDSVYPRNDGSTNRLYIGTGNDFGIEHTYVEAYSEETGVDYSTVFPEY